MSDTMVVGMWAINLFVTLAMGVGLTVGLRSNDRRLRKIESQETEIKSLAKDLVQAEIVTQIQPLQTSINLLTLQITTANAKIEKGEGLFNGLMNADHLQELKNVSNLGELKLWVTQQAATKEELDGVIDRVDKLHTLLAGDMVDRIEAAAARMERATTATVGKRGG